MIILKFNNEKIRKILTNVINVSVIENIDEYQEDYVLCFYFNKLDKSEISEIEKNYRDFKRIYIFEREIAHYFFNYIKTTAASYILVNEIDSQFESCYLATMSNGVYISSFFRQILTISNSNNNLTARDLDVIKLLSEGYSYKDIANITHLQYGTVRNYVSKVLEITNLKNKTELALYFQRIFNKIEKN
ncbi:MAG: response regulator transcription factor [Bacilli bacterium]